MNEVKANQTVDAKGLACPMPIVRTKKAMKELEAGQVMEILATDKGSKADLKAWSESTGHQYLGTVEEGEVLKHYVRKASEYEEQPERHHPHVIKNDELTEKIAKGESLQILDVREEAEYAFGHIPGALSVPFGRLQQELNKLNQDEPIYVICRTGNRSDMAAQLLESREFKAVNVVPGMNSWSGKVEGI
ncbi:sulfurtransferase TusA family protein [Cytobacillus kochii]